jgi:hypothetical protein
MMSSMSVPPRELRRSIVSLDGAWLTEARDASFKLYWTPWVVSLAGRPLAVGTQSSPGNGSIRGIPNYY